MKIGMVGLDTSHCPAFAGILNNEEGDYRVAGGKVVAAFPGGSAIFSSSRDRVAGYTQRLADEFGIQMVDSIPALAQQVDAVLLESVDGRQHLDQFAQLAIGKPVFIDKPLATSSADARAIFRIAAETKTPVMSSSSLRYSKGIADLVSESEKVISCEAFGPAALLDDYPGLFWYGIHSAEMLFGLMGAGCKTVQCVARETMDVVVGEWEDGRLGVMRGTRFDKGQFGCIVHTDAGARCGLAQSQPPGYYLLMQQVMGFFETGISPISVQEMYEVAAFLEAADESRARGGAVVSLQKL